MRVLLLIGRTIKANYVTLDHNRARGAPLHVVWKVRTIIRWFRISLKPVISDVGCQGCAFAWTAREAYSRECSPAAGNKSYNGKGNIKYADEEKIQKI